MPFVNERTEDGQWQTIDRDRGVILLYDGRLGADHPYNFFFKFEDATLRVEAFRRLQTQSNNKYLITWNIVGLHIPEHLADKTEEIKDLLSEAFDVCGFLFNRKYAEAVNVEFSAYQI